MSALWEALGSTQTQGAAKRLLGGTYVAVIRNRADTQTATLEVEMSDGTSWVETNLKFSDSTDDVQTFFASAAFRYRMKASAAGAVVEIGTVDRSSAGATA